MSDIDIDFAAIAVQVDDAARRHFMEFREHDRQGSMSDTSIAVAAGSH